MKILKLKNNLNDVLDETISTLNSGGLVVFPSDTVYGLLVDAKAKKAIEKLIKFKQRPPGKPISVFVSDLKMMKSLAKINPSQEKILKKILPGKYTCVFDSKHKTSKKLESEKSSIGLRFVDFLPIDRLLKEYKKPVTATSANLSGRSANYSVNSLLNSLPKSKTDLIDLVVDYGKLPINKPSTVVDFTSEKLEILRKGEMQIGSKNTREIISKSPLETRKIGKDLIDQIIKKSKKQNNPIIIILKGDLGAGKTEMTRAFADYFDIKKIVSPTFVIYYEYEIDQKKYSGYKKFIHADLYNIEDKSEFKNLKLENYLTDKNIMVIEWGERLGRLFEKFKENAKTIFIEIQHGEDIDQRVIKITD